ncbi:hypothetical protein HWV62_2396 [Athelia sp. TMB]|nr:hypothetical protein HWV62_30999 [Athelia sp. TMB]KAF7977869.1 hypothetical protein HWV62_2396 [Athelia sp. TMB]
MLNHNLAVYPPLNGTVLAPNLVDFNIDHNAELTAFVFSDSPGSVTKISYLEYGRAAHRVGHLVRPGRTGPEGQVVAVIANLDTLLYAALVAGMIRAGIVPFPISPRNSAEAVVSMLRKSRCHNIITTFSSLGNLMNEIYTMVPQSFELSIQEAPTLAQCFPKLGHEIASHDFQAYPTRPTPLDRNEPIFYLHSSGSTGFPKPIAETCNTMLGWCSLDAMIDFRELLCVGTMHLPAFHALGTIMHFIVPLSSITTVALYPPTSLTDPTKLPIIPSSDNIIEHCNRTGVDVLVAVPSFLETWNVEPASIEWLKTLHFVVTTGGPLAPKIGDALVKQGVKMVSVYGGTEFGITSTISDGADERSPEDWNYMRFSELTNIRWVPQGDGTYENQFLDSDVHKVSVRNLGDVNGYSTSDCWEPHPTKPNLWRLVGRLDDVLILASGENVVPAPTENTLMSSPLVSGAVVFGRGRNQVGILLEPNSRVKDNDVAEFRNRVWPVVEEANKGAPAFSRIFKEMILVTNPNKPMLRVGKGTVAKKGTLKIYESEIEALYEAVEANMGNADPPRSWNAVDVEAWLSAQAQDISSQSVIDPSVDNFSQGFDSLSATSLRNRILGTLRSSSDPRLLNAASGITQNFIFSYPTIKQLASRISRLVSGDEDETESATRAIESLIEKYSSGLVPVHRGIGSAPVDVVVLLTGSTGGLGSFLLEAFLKDARVQKIYAYNRPAKGSTTIRKRQEDAFTDKGLDAELLNSKKLNYVEADSALPKLGLSDELYEEANFNLSLASFEPNIRGTRNLIDLATRSEHASTSRFLFTSSVASTQGWDKSRGAYPEEVQFDVSTALGGGYGEAKYVCERILERSGLYASSFRIGQITGGKINGAWATSDWVPAFIKSSLALGALPDAQGVASWMPVHTVSQVIIDVTFAKESPISALNLVHPKPTSWSTILKYLSDALYHTGVTSHALPLVPFLEWFGRLEQRSKDADEQSMTDIPAIKILEFFRGSSSADAAIRQTNDSNLEAAGLTTLSTIKCQGASNAMKEAPAIDAEDAERWVRYWISRGFLSALTITMDSLLRWGIENSSPPVPGAAPPVPRTDLDPAIIDMILGKPDAVLMKEALAIAIDEMKSEDERVEALDQIEMLIESIDNANDLAKLQMWRPLQDLLASSSPAIVTQTLWVIGTALQNNPSAQISYLELDPIAKLVSFIRPETDSSSTRSKAVYALSGLLKHNAVALKALGDDGWSALQGALEGVRRKAAFLLNALLLLEPPTSSGSAGPQTVYPNSHASMLSDPNSASTSAVTLSAFKEKGILDSVISALVDFVPFGADGDGNADLHILYTYTITCGAPLTEAQRDTVARFLSMDKRDESGVSERWGLVAEEYDDLREKVGLSKAQSGQ